MNNFFVTNPIKMPLGQNVLDVKSKLAKLLGLREKDIVSFELKKQSVDARDKGNVHFVCSYVVECTKNSPKNAQPYQKPQDLLAANSSIGQFAESISPIAQSTEQHTAQFASQLTQLVQAKTQTRQSAQTAPTIAQLAQTAQKANAAPITPFAPTSPIEQSTTQNATANNLRNKHCIVVGGGPAGLFLARYLTQCGAKVTVIERGSDVEKRSIAVQKFFNGGEFDPETNVQFGLGGAGTFSDGKLTTGISSPLVHTVFHEFVRCGAPSDILTDALPHIGTDNLVSVVANLRNKITQSGGEFLFDTFVSDIIVQNGKAVGVEVVHTSNGGAVQRLFADCVALCCGHSSRELFETLLKRGVSMQFKPFAVGLRIEHPREFINRTQYGELFATHRDLGAASYKLVNNTPTHSCYSFCMCPGGVVVPANSQRQTVVVNGMSNYARNAPNSNSALVVTVSQKDAFDYGFGNGVLAGMDFQQALEKAAYSAGGGNYRAPYQNVTDFLAKKVSQKPDIAPSYPRGVMAVDFHTLLPKQICDILEQSLLVFDKKMKNFAKCGVLTGVETRTSSPVKILRDENMQSNICGLFPVGEGAGYAGGIVSSAVDGLKAAQKIAEFLQNCR